MTSTILPTSTIASLPVELLREIFRFCVSTDRDQGYMKYDMSWVNFSHVCFRWRTVALSCPDLWSNIVFSRPEWTDVMLERSGLAPLSFRVNIDEVALYERMMLYLFSNLDRLQTLDIKTLSRSRFKAFLEYLEEFPSLAPVLESIIFVLPLSYHDGVVLSADLFAASGQSSLPGLRRLTLTGAAFAWDSAHYSNLTQLHIDVPDIQRPTFMQLVRMLSSSPCLESLDLGAVDMAGVKKSSQVRVSLPCLRLLALQDTLRGCAYVLAALSLPATTVLRITLVGLMVEELELHSELHTDHTYYLQFIFSALFSRQLDESHSLALMTASKTSQWDLCGLRVGHIFTLRVLCSLGDDLFPSTLEHIRTHFFLNMRKHHCRVSTLFLDMEVLPTSRDHHAQGITTFWSHLYALPDVTDLVVTDHVPSLLFEYLLERTMHRIGIGRPVRYPPGPYGLLPMSEDVLPKLHSIYLEDVPLNAPSTHADKERVLKEMGAALGAGDFTAAAAAVFDNERTRTVPSFAQILRAFLWARNANASKTKTSCGIALIRLEECQLVYDADVAYFRSFCDLQWDGRGRLRRPSEVLVEGKPGTDSGTESDLGPESTERYSTGVYERLFSPFAAGVEEPDTSKLERGYMYCGLFALE